MSAETIHCGAVSAGYDGVAVVDELSFTLHSGETLAIVGRSGCGKSTILKTLAGILPPIDGQATVLGTQLPQTPPAGSLGYIPQGLGLVPHETVRKNVLHGTLFDLGPVRSLLGRFPEQAEANAAEAIDWVGLEEKADCRVTDLSGGQRRRVAIARAFVQQPRVLLADEMLSELDAATAQTIVQCLSSLQQDTGMSVLMVEHQTDVARAIADSILTVDNSRPTDGVHTASLGR